MSSIWEKGAVLPSFPSVGEDRQTEVLIIGGGMTGLLCGYFLEKQGRDYMILEQGRIAEGTTKNTTAKLTWQHGLIYDRLRRTMGRDTAAAYLAAGSKALNAFEHIIAEQNIDCDYEKADSYVYSTAVNEIPALLQEAETITALGGKGDFVEHVEIPLKVSGAVRVKNQASFHPLRFLEGLVPEMNIFERSFVKDIKKQSGGYAAEVTGESGETHRISAGQVIAATHFPMINRYGLYFLKLYQSRSYAAALSSTGLSLKGMYIGTQKNSLSFRGWRDHVILGGCGGRTGCGCAGADGLKKEAERLFPGGKLECCWAAQDCMSLDGMPYIGQYSPGTPGLMVAGGYSKWGMTGSMTAAMVLTGELDPELAAIFRPDRSMLKPQLFVNGYEAVKNLVTPAGPRCTHMRCALKRNEEEHSWDCSCHGSRFDEEGRILNNPAKRQLKVGEK